MISPRLVLAGAFLVNVAQTTLSDIRDSNSYIVRKLADGSCWMTQNLRLQNYKLTPDDSNIAAGTTFDLPASDGSRFCTTSNSTDCDGRPNVLDSGNTSYGVYYNWYAATAGYGTYSMSSGDVSYSICPKGWRLPTSTEFQALYNNYNSTSAMMGASGPAFVLSGNRNGSSTTDRGSYGNYWSSTAYSSNDAYNLALGSSYINPQRNFSKYYGFTVRCVAATSMQDFSVAEHAADAVGTTYNLTDTRDGKVYSAKKLADGNIWMMKNLELDLPAGQTSRTLTPEDSDVSADWPLTDNSNGTPGWCNEQTDECRNQSLISRTGYDNNGATAAAPTYYYNWYTATAGTGTSAVASGDVSDSICPKGWKLPTTAQFQALDQAYGGTGANRTDASQITNFTQNVGFGFTGNRNAASVSGPTSYAFYWSRSASSATNAYNLRFYSGNGDFYPRNNNGKWLGFAVRCFAAQ